LKNSPYNVENNHKIRKKMLFFSKTLLKISKYGVFSNHEIAKITTTFFEKSINKIILYMTFLRLKKRKTT